jgi:hypothetical protein
MLLKEPMRSTSQSVDRPGRRCTTDATQLVRGDPVMPAIRALQSCVKQAPLCRQEADESSGWLTLF